MPIRFACTCGRVFNLRDDLGGKRARCPDCGTILTVPTEGIRSASTRITKAKPAESDRSTIQALTAAQRSAATQRSSVSAPATAPTAPTTKPTAANPTSPKDAQIETNTSKRSFVKTTEDAQVCPACKKRVPTKVLICPHCSWHFKLKKKVQGFSEAIKAADFNAQGLSNDGEGEARRIADVKERDEQEKKSFSVMKLVVAVLVLTVLAVIGRAVYTSFASMSLNEIRALQKLPTARFEDFTTWQPPLVYQTGDNLLTGEIPIGALHFTRLVGEAKTSDFEEKVSVPKKWPRRERVAGARFAETVMAPVVNTLVERGSKSRYNLNSSRVMPTIVKTVNTLGGRFALNNLDEKMPPGRIVIWRIGETVSKIYGLSGAILDISEDEQAKIVAAMREWKEEVAKRESLIQGAILRTKNDQSDISESTIRRRIPLVAEPRLKISARLSFIPFVNRDLRSGNDGYAGAVSNGSLRVKDINAKPRTRADFKDLTDPNGYYFAPVLLVDNVQIIYPKTEDNADTVKPTGS